VKKDPGEEEESRVCDEESVGDAPPPHPPPAPEKERKKGNAKVNPLKAKFKKMLVGWEKIDVTFENFPYYLKLVWNVLFSCTCIEHFLYMYGSVIAPNLQIVFIELQDGSFSEVFAFNVSNRWMVGWVVPINV
jgi:hypothetical protein